MNHPDIFGLGDGTELEAPMETLRRKRARRSDPETSQTAAAMLSTAATHCARLLGTYATHPSGLSDYEAAVIAGLYKAGRCTWHRCSDLRALGLIAFKRTETGKHVTTDGPNGRPMRLSTITAAGRVEARRLGV